MAKPQYRLLRIDTTAARTSGEFIVNPGENFDGLKLLSAPGGAAIELNWYGTTDNDHFVPMAAGDQVVFKDDCDNPFKANEGLTMRNAAAVGVAVIYLSQGVSV